MLTAIRAATAGTAVPGPVQQGWDPPPSVAEAILAATYSPAEEWARPLAERRFVADGEADTAIRPGLDWMKRASWIRARSALARSNSHLVRPSCAGGTGGWSEWSIAAAGAIRGRKLPHCCAVASRARRWYHMAGIHPSLQ